MKEKKYFFGILTYFKNEKHILNEWILHYKKWGVDHIWMVDNGSEDDYDISEFINEGYVTVYKEPMLDQQSAYDKYLKEIKNEVKWLCNCDLDEFLYSKEKDNIKEILRNFVETDIISIQMTIFFPATFETPLSIIQTNVLRKCKDSKICPKCIYNLDKVNNIGIHGIIGKFKRLYINCDETLLCINHYRYTSFEYLYGIKEGRGCNPFKNANPIHLKKYNFSAGHKFMNLINEKKFLSDDTFLKNHSHSKEILHLLKHQKPKLELYPKSSFLKLKNFYKEKYNQFKNYNEILTHKQINEINLFLNNIAINNE